MSIQNLFSDEELLNQPDWRDLEFSFPQRNIRLATCFSGIGAIEHAFKRLHLNYEIVFAGDIDERCKQSYFANYQIDESRWHSDIHEFNAKAFKGKVDILVGGAPCQAFSMVGKRLGLEDTRGTLFYEFARVISECQPKVFIFENVKGITNHDKGRTWQIIKSVFADLGYDIHEKILNSRDYGIPQNRERMFCIGFREKTEFEYPVPIPLEIEANLTITKKLLSHYKAVLAIEGVHYNA